MTYVTHEVRYGDWCLEQEIVRRLGPAGAELASRRAATQEALLARLGASGFELLDAHESAVAALSGAREEAIMALCAGRRGSAASPDR